MHTRRFPWITGESEERCKALDFPGGWSYTVRPPRCLPPHHRQLCPRSHRLSRRAGLPFRRFRSASWHAPFMALWCGFWMGLARPTVHRSVLVHLVFWRSALTNSSASGDHVRVVRPRRRRRDLGCTLTDLDHRLLDLLCSLRVVRQDQLERLFPEVPERTLRHRMRRLHEHGLAGRSRPYRERGSAPNHHWPTRRAAGVARGEPVPRGGDRGEPNPLFLAHT